MGIIEYGNGYKYIMEMLIYFEDYFFCLLEVLFEVFVMLILVFVREK